MRPDEVAAEIKKAGGTLEKKDGDHWVYRLPNGRTFWLPVGGKHSSAKKYLLPKLRKALSTPPLERNPTAAATPSSLLTPLPMPTSRPR